MSVYRDIRKQLEASLQPKLAKANPLRTIGFSYEILRLGLSEDELYDYAYATARNLFGRIHPDRARTTEIKEQQDRVSEAFDLLKDRTLFTKWLRDFSEELSCEREEISALRQSDGRMKSMYDADKATINTLSEQIAREGLQQKAVTKSFCDYLLLRTQFFRESRVFSAEQNLILQVLSFTFYYPKDGSKPENRGEVLFSVKDVNDRCINQIPNARRSNELVLAFASLRRFLSSHTTLPFIGIKIQELKTESGYYNKLDHPVGTRRVILGTLSPEDSTSLSFSVGPCMSVKLDSLVPLLRNEIYPSVLLVADNLNVKPLAGVEAEAQLRNLRLKVSKILPTTFVSNVVIDVHSSDPT